ncbi:MAG: tetratricopeptide repeat-containing sulfotransferase family protein [Acidiferrobacter sp.]
MKTCPRPVPSTPMPSAADTANAHHPALEKELSQALADHRAGRLAAAEDRYRALLSRYPHHPAIVHNFGVLALQTGRTAQGIAGLKAALQADPHNTALWLNTFRVLYKAGEKAEAKTLLAHAVRASVPIRTALVELVAMLVDTQNGEDAEAILHHFLTLYPESVAALSNLGELRRRQHDYATAEHYLNQALHLKPDFLEARLNLAAVFTAQNRLAEAARMLQAILATHPDHVTALSHLSEVQLYQDRCGEAEATVRKALRLAPDSRPALLNLAAILAQQDRFGEAEEILLRLKADAPHHPETLINLGAIWLKQDRYAEAEAALTQARTLQTDHPEVLTNLAEVRLKTGRFATLHDEVLTFWESGQGRFNTRAKAAFLLADDLHKRHQYDEAFSWYRLGQAVLRQKEPYNHATWLQEVEAEFAHFAHLPKLLTPCPTATPQPIFIVGMPRSGTSLIEQILDCHPDITGAGELDDITRMVAAGLLQATGAGPLEAARAIYEKRRAAQAPTARYVTDKMPHNFLHLGLISALWPKTPILYCVREGRDNCLSLFQQQFKDAHPYAHTLTDLGHHYRAHEAIVARWQTVIPNPVLCVRYEEVVEDLEGQVRRLLTFLKLPFEPRCLNFYQNPRKILTASRDQVTQPLYKSSVGRWQAYAAHLTPLLTALNAGCPHLEPTSSSAKMDTRPAHL